MITILTGENSFEIDRALRQVVAEFDGVSEKIDGSELELRQLPDLLMGGTLFADRRLVVIRDLSANKALWGDFEQWIPRVHDDVHLVLIEQKLDKRTKTYKKLQAMATIYEPKQWTERDVFVVEQWVLGEASKLGVAMDKKSVQVLVRRVGVDQWLLAQALQKLAVVAEVSPSVIERLIDANPTENVFDLLDAALRGDAQRVSEMIRVLEVVEDPYRLFGLLGTQVFQLGVLAVSDRASAVVAKDFGAHPFALSKLAPHAKRLGRGGVRKIVAAMAEADRGMKTSVGEPWLLIERALVKIATV
jgi:DNA polymerase-3 subunit delta